MTHPHPSDITPDVTTGHIATHKEMAEWWNRSYYVGDTGDAADIADALILAHGAGGGTVKCLGLAYAATSVAGVALLDITLPTVNLDLNGAVITYTGAGTCLRKRMDPMTNTRAGYVVNGTIDGTGSSAGAIGIQTGNVVGATWSGVTVQGFSGAGSIGWDSRNFAAPTVGWMERCQFHVASLNNTIDFRFGADAGQSSFLYNEFDLRFNVDTGQTAFQTLSPAQLFDCQLNFRGNVDNAGTIFDLAPQSVVRPTGHVTVEQTNGTGAVLFAPGSDQHIYPTGHFQFNNFPGYDTGIIMPNYEGRGVQVVFDTKIRNSPVDPIHAFGLTVGDGTLGAFVAVYDGGAGADFALLKVPFAGSLADARVAAQLDSVTKAEIGFRPGVFTSGSRPAAGAVPQGTMVYISDVAGGIPVWSTGAAWHDAAGNVA